jgi:hypothetical protein
MGYRISRSLEASVIDYLTTQLNDDGWKGIRVEKVFAEVYKGTLPCILIGVDNVSPEKLEIGSKINLKYYQISIRIFATSDGLREDLSDWLLELLEDDINYYTYGITSGEVSEKTLSGKIIITEISRNEKELTNTENLSVEDRYRNITVFKSYIAFN